MPDTNPYQAVFFNRIQLLFPLDKLGNYFFFISVKLTEKGSYTVISHMYGLRLQRNLETGQLFFF